MIEDETEIRDKEGASEAGHQDIRRTASIAALCRRERIAESLFYNWSKELLEAAKKRLAGNTARAATGDEVKVRA
jgi:transposase